MKKVLKECLEKLKRKIKDKKNLEPLIDIVGNDRNKVWAFCSGQFSNDFRGNPKFLFIYINKYRSDIEAYWLCTSDEIIKQVRSMGFRAYKIGTKQSEQAIAKTGVLVSEQVKMDIPAGLEKAKYLNLWHGVGGVKNVERSIDSGILLEQIATKYIDKNEYYRENELYLATSDFINDIAIKQLGLTDKQIIKAGYPRNIYQAKYERINTFEFDECLKDLPEDTKIVAYTPTYRNSQTEELFIRAIPDIEKLIKVCEKKHILFIFKMHPLLEKESSFLSAKEKHKDCKWLKFWDNNNDFYEIMNRVDLCIYDFSSIFTDFVAMGTKYFIRYNFDFEKEDLNFPIDYDEVTLGPKCKTFDKLLEKLETFEKMDLSEDIKRINEFFWQYNCENSMDKIINETLAFKPLKLNLPILYSFDIFDTLLTRKVLEPVGIFYYVKEKIYKESSNYPKYLIDNFPTIRKNAEANVREYYNRTIEERNDSRCEISLLEIYDRIKTMYNLTDTQRNHLMDLEIEAELENVLPIPENIEKLKDLYNSGEKVVLISDMYLPEEVIRKMLKKADPLLEKIDLYLSSTYGYEKAKKTLYLEVYKKYGVNYNFKKWIHTGDNQKSDIEMPKKLKIEAHRVIKLAFNQYEKNLVDSIKTYDAYLVAGNMARFRNEIHSQKEEFVYSYVSLLFVPYIYWAIHDSKKSGYQDLYFISRDGHNLKKIADKINEIENLKLNTKYIYASRKTWRVPSFIDHIDIDFWGSGHGNFSDVRSYSNLLKALCMNEKEFLKIFPQLEYLKEKEEINSKEKEELVNIFKASEAYEKFLLNKAKIMRESTCGYLKQEIDAKNSFAVIEYWGRGYTQENFTRLWHHIIGKEEPVTFYYSRSTLPTEGYNIRKNFTVNSKAQQFIEAIFNCINYKSIEKYEKKNQKWYPIIDDNPHDSELFAALEKYLVVFAEEYTKTNFIDRDSIGKSLIDFAINYYTSNLNWDGFVNILSKCQDSVQIYGEIKKYAPALTSKDIELLEKKERNISNITKSATLSLNNTNNAVKEKFDKLFQTEYNNGKAKLNKMLSKSEYNKSIKLIKEYNMWSSKSKELNHYYQEWVDKTEVVNKVVVLTSNLTFNDLEYYTLFKELESQNKYVVTKICLKNPKLESNEIAKELAEAKYIITKLPIKLLHSIIFRKETKIIVLSDTVMNYFSKGMSKITSIKAEEKLVKLQYKMQTDILQIPSINLKKLYNRIYNVKENVDYLISGSVMTDCYFNEGAKRNLRNKLNQKFEAASGKKVICYIPYDRYRNEKYLNFLNLYLLKEELQDEYVVIIHCQKKYKDIENSLNISNFSMDLTETFNVREQMMIADIIIGDYRDTTFEAPLLNVPVFITNWDKVNINANNTLMYDFDEIKYGIEIESTDDLITKIKNIDSFDYKPQNNFKEKYLKECNGNSAKKLIDYLLKK